MTEEEVAEFFERWSGHGDEVRRAWLAEIEQSGKVAEWQDVLILLAEQDEDLAKRMVGLRKWWADAPRRNASKKRPRSSWKRELAAHFRQEDARGKQTRLAKFRSLPREFEEPLRLGKGKWEITRHNDGKIWCEFDTGQKPDAMKRPGFSGGSYL